MRQIYIVKSDGDPIYCRSLEDDVMVNSKSLPLFVRNSVTLFHSRSSTSSERVYTLEHEGLVWSYAFFHSFVLVSMSDRIDANSDTKNVLLSMGRSLSHRFSGIIDSWSGSMSEIVDIDELIDQYIAVNTRPLSDKLMKKIEKQVDKALLKPEIAFVGIFDGKGEMIRGNIPESHLFRIEVEISQGMIKPVIDIAPTSVNSGDYKLQMLRVNTLTVVAAAQLTESTLRAVAVVGEIAHTLYEMM